MICYITTTSFGFIATNQNNEIIDYELFTDKIEKLEETSKPETLIEKLDNNYAKIIIETNRPQLYNDNPKITTQKTTPQGRYIRDNFDDIILEITKLENSSQITDVLNKTYNQITQDKIRKSIRLNDVMITETIHSIEELDETTGKLIERLHEWCMPYLPELDKIHNQQLYTKLIANETTRENIKKSPLLENTNITLSDANDVEIDDEDLKIIKDYAKSLLKLYETKNELEKYIDKKIKQVAPNMYNVTGANLSAKLIAHINGLENLAKLPSSTIQIIGAEKATFRHLKTGENPPKHGLIYQHPSLRGSNWWVRGKIARTIANKIAIAARKDAFGNGDIDENLRSDLDAKIDKIKKNHPFPERKNKKENKKNKKSKNSKKDKRMRKQKGKKRKRNKQKLKKEDYNY